MNCVETVTEALRALSVIRPVFHAEADFQHALAWHIHQLLADHALRLEWRPFGTERFYLDLWLRGTASSCAIELKYSTRGLTTTVDNEPYVLSDQGAQDLIRYDFVKDLSRLERIVLDHPGAVGIGLLLTNDSAYWKEPRTFGTVDAAFRLHEGRRLSGQLEWASHVGGTARGRESLHDLRGSYALAWRDYSRVPAASYGAFRYLLVPVELAPGDDEQASNA